MPLSAREAWRGMEKKKPWWIIEYLKENYIGTFPWGVGEDAQNSSFFCQTDRKYLHICSNNNWIWGFTSVSIVRTVCVNKQTPKYQWFNLKKKVYFSSCKVTKETCVFCRSFLSRSGLGIFCVCTTSVCNF